MSNAEITVYISQVSSFPRRIPLTLFTDEGLRYGFLREDLLIKDRTSPEGMIVYDPKLIGRGIRTDWKKEEEKSITLSLPMPASAEEIELLFRLTDRISECWTCSIMVNGEYVMKRSLDDLQDSLTMASRKYFSDLLQNVQEGPFARLRLSCAMHPLNIGEEEVFRLSGGAELNKFRDWLHELQSQNNYFAGIIPDEKEKTDRMIIPSDVSVIIPEPAELAGKEIMITLFDSQRHMVIGQMPVDIFLKVLPASVSESFDAGNMRLRAQRADELVQLIRKAAQLSENEE